MNVYVMCNHALNTNYTNYTNLFICLPVYSAAFYLRNLCDSCSIHNNNV